MEEILGYLIVFIAFFAFVNFILLINFPNKKELEEIKSRLVSTRRQLEASQKDLYSKQQHIYELNKEIQRIQGEIKEKEKEYTLKDRMYLSKDIKYTKIEKLSNQLKNDIDSGIKNLSELSADYNVIEYEILAKHNEQKERPAIKRAQDIRELKAKTRQILQENKIMKYKYEMFFKLFPELENYADNLQAIKNNFSGNLNDFQEEYDRTRDYLSDDEYKSLSVTQRNQLALDRYIKKDKTDWQIGRDYELFVGQMFEKCGYSISFFGIERQLEDLGRDIIAKKDNNTLIIQCKNWSKNKQIHEKHIAQLYGTTVQYIIENNCNSNNVIPVLVTTTVLSEQAKIFAKYLKVEVVEQQKLEEFPRIKCNIGKDGKIYHLPMDQQYDRVIIEKEKGEFFAKTVKEAEEKGFRRAKKFYY